MHPARIQVTTRRTLLALALALGVGSPPPAQAYLLDFTVASINPGVRISHAGGSSSRPSPVGSKLMIIDVSRTGDPGCQFSPTIAPSNNNPDFLTEPLVASFSDVRSAASVWMLGGTSLHGSLTLQGGIPALTMSDDTALVSGSFGTARVTEPAPVQGNLFSCLAGSNFTDHKDDALPASFGFHRQTANEKFDPGLAASFASAPGVFTSTMVPSSNILHQLAPFYSNLLLLGCGLMGLVGLRYRRRRG